MWLVWLAVSVAFFVLDWLRKRDRDERFADRPPDVRSDLFKLYQLDD